jgi:hypothetical protein
MTQTKRDTLVLQVAGWGMGLTTPTPQNNNIVRNPANDPEDRRG